MNQVAVLFLVFLLLLCMMKGKRTVEGLCGCRTGENLDVTIQAGSDFNCPHTGTGKMLYLTMKLLGKRAIVARVSVK